MAFSYGVLHYLQVPTCIDPVPEPVMSHGPLHGFVVMLILQLYSNLLATLSNQLLVKLGLCPSSRVRRPTFLICSH